MRIYIHISGESVVEDLFTPGDELLERAKHIARRIDDTIKKLADDPGTSTIPSPDDSDRTDEWPALNEEAG